MNILLINITRFGDTLQAQPLIHALYSHFASESKKCNIGLVCVENFVNAGQLLQNISDIFPLPSSYFLKKINYEKAQYLEALNAFEMYTNKLIDTFNPDIIINLTPTVVARLLAKKISLALEKKGKKVPMYAFSLDEFGFSHNSNIWASYTQAVTLNRLSSPFNLADCFTLLGGLELLEKDISSSYADILLTKQAQNPAIRACTKEEKEKAYALLNENLNGISRDLANLAYSKTQAAQQNSISKNDLSLSISKPKHAYIAFQLGASAEKRQYSIEHFAKLSNLLHAKGYTIVLLGARNEEALVEKFYLAKGVGINLVGKTDLAILAAVLKECAMIISNDTGTMHLAASLGIPILALFLATAQPWDTGPISTDACLIEANMPCHPCAFSHVCKEDFACKNAVSAEVLADLADARLTQGKWPNYFAAKARIWSSQRDSEGFLILKPLDIIEKNSRESLYLMQRAVYKNTLELLANKKEKVELAISQYVKSLDKAEKESLLSTISIICDLYVLLQQQTKLMGNMEKMKLGFLSTNEKITALFKSNPSTLALSYLWEYCMQANDINAVSFSQTIDKFEMTLNAWKKALLLEQ